MELSPEPLDHETTLLTTTVPPQNLNCKQRIGLIRKSGAEADAKIPFSWSANASDTELQKWKDAKIGWRK